MPESKARSSAMLKHQEAQVKLERQMQEEFDAFAMDYPVDHPFPAKVEPLFSEKSLRTNSDLIQHRLIEAGIMFDDTQTVQQIMEASDRFIRNMVQSGCFHTVQVCLDQDDSMKENGGGRQSLKVVLNERNWYKLYVGGGLKQDGAYFAQTASDSLLPKVQFETSGSLLNLTGRLDTTSVQYALDQTSSSTLRFTHERPLFSIFPQDSDICNLILSGDNGSQLSVGFNAVLDTLDYEWTRSYKEYQRKLSLGVANTSVGAPPESVEGGYHGVDWSLLFRDVLPRRHPTQPFSLDASPEIVTQSGPSVKHSLRYGYYTNGKFCDDRFSPTQGVDYHTQLEVAGPPGDVGFLKCQAGIAGHIPLVELKADSNNSISLHGSFRSGLLHAISFGGLCGPPTISDRFHLGGPLQLRGFLPSGVGPRAKSGGASVPGGDALGGEFFYAATLAASLPFPPISFLEDSGLRLFAFSNIGTLTSLNMASWQSILRSTRTSVGCGITMSTPFGRMEATYSIPTRCGPRDARKAVQFGLGFTFG